MNHRLVRLQHLQRIAQILELGDKALKLLVVTCLAFGFLLDFELKVADLSNDIELLLPAAFQDRPLLLGLHQLGFQLDDAGCMPLGGDLLASKNRQLQLDTGDLRDRGLELRW